LICCDLNHLICCDLNRRDITELHINSPNSYFWFLVSAFRFPVSSFRFPVSCLAFGEPRVEEPVEELLARAVRRAPVLRRLVDAHTRLRIDRRLWIDRRFSYTQLRMDRRLPYKMEDRWTFLARTVRRAPVLRRLVKIVMIKHLCIDRRLQYKTLIDACNKNINRRFQYKTQDRWTFLARAVRRAPVLRRLVPRDFPKLIIVVGF